MKNDLAARAKAYAAYSAAYAADPATGDVCRAGAQGC